MPPPPPTSAASTAAPTARPPRPGAVSAPRRPLRRWARRGLLAACAWLALGPTAATAQPQDAEFKSQTGTLTLKSPHYGATLIVDRQPRGKLPVRAPIALTAGLHLVEVTAPGRPRWARLVWIDAGAAAVLEVRFSALVAAAAPTAPVPGARSLSAQPVPGAPSAADLAAFGPGRVAAPAAAAADGTSGTIAVAGDAGGIGGRPPTRVHLAGSTGMAFARAGADADVDLLQRFEVAVADLGPDLDGVLSGRAFADVYTAGRALRRVVQPSRSAVVRLDDARLRWRPGAWQAEGGRVPFLGPGRSAAAVDGARLQSPASPGDGLLGGWQAHLLGGRGVTPFGPRPEHPLLLGLGLGRAAVDRFAPTETPPETPPPAARPQALATDAAPRPTGDAAAVWYDRRLHLDAGVGLGTAAWQTGARTGWVDGALAEADLRIHAFAAGLDGGLVLAARRPVGGPFRLVDAFADPALALRPDHHAVRAELGGGLGALGAGWTRHLRWGLDGELRRARDAPAAANPHLLRADLHLDHRLGAFDLGLDLGHLVADAGPFDPAAASAPPRAAPTAVEPEATRIGQTGRGQAALLARQRLAARARWRHQRLALDATLGASRLHLRADDGSTRRRWLPEGGGRARLAVAPGVELVAELSARAVHPQLYPGGGPLWDGLLALVIR